MNQHHEFERLAAFAEDQLEPLERATIEAHLRGCEECRRALADIARSIALANELEIEELPRETAAAMRAQLLKAPRPIRWVAAAAALALLVGSALYWQVNRPWAVMRGAVDAPTAFEQEGRRLHTQLRSGASLDYAPRDDRDAWDWLAAQGAPVAGLLPDHPADQRPRYQVIGAAVDEVAGARASVLSYRIDGRPVTLVLAHRRDVANAPRAGLLSKTVTHRREGDANVLTWSVGGGTYVMVSELEDHGQRACFVCHTERRFQSTILALRPQ
ncbi:MAG TPA: zf-HC2 domain-containing protein [Vicinamibacterales bacterium]|nr:zf-HC2 domain-containing protein [Vicinamibacterales bacterium]